MRINAQSLEPKKELEMLCDVVSKALQSIEHEMCNPSTRRRGERIAKICNGLKFANDSAMRYGLGLGFDKINK